MYFQKIDNCFAWCHKCPEDLGVVCLVFFLFEAVMFSTECILEIRYSCYEWKLQLYSRSVDFPLLKRTWKKIMEES